MPKCKCGSRFVASNSRQKLCPDCHTTRKHHTERGLTEFVGVDGEGVTRPDGTHEYVLLSVGERSLYHEDGRRLTWYDIIPFLWSCFLDNPTAAYVGFYLGYDFTQWLRDLPENRARALLTTEGIERRKRTRSGQNHVPFPVEHRGFQFDILGLKRLRLWQDESDLRMYVCDAGAFFQTSFLNAINPEKWPDGAVLSDVEFKQIAKGKEERGTEIIPYGTPVDEEMIAYNILENTVLARLMRRYDEGLQNVGIYLKRDQWFGPGQAAQSWMNKIKAPTRKQFEDATDIGLRNRFRASYYGGWFEIMAHGHIPGRSYSYDINSAYPDIQSNLPCVLHGNWTSGIGATFAPVRYVLIYGTLHGSHARIGAAPHRTPSGHILRPQKTRGWYWLHEIEAAQSAGLLDTCDVEEWVSYEPCDCPPPFYDERALYEDRLRVGKNTMGGKARRLVYNSTYGKTAQSIGTAKFANPFYASLITSMCRTYILRAIALHPHGANDVLMVATDGITFKRRNPRLALSETALGHWSETVHENLTLFMPGIYWDDRTRRKLQDGGAPTLKSRGIPALSLGKRVMDIDRRFRDCYSGNGFPTLGIPLAFTIVSPKQALARNSWNTCGTVSTTEIRQIDSSPRMKRNADATYIENGIIRTDCYPRAAQLDTTPYRKTFGDEELKTLLHGLTDDGEAAMLIAHALHQ